VTPDAFARLALLMAAPFVGSFLGVLALRLPEGRSVVAGRSACRACGKVLGPLELVPLVSWLVQRGRCRTCGTRLSVFYPAIELAALAVAAAAALATSGAAFFLACLIGWIALVPVAMGAVRLFGKGKDGGRDRD
jgi:leader peptidase (prepilin peptidase)/N-methyltransferase